MGERKSAKYSNEEEEEEELMRKRKRISRCYNPKMMIGASALMLYDLGNKK